MLVLNKLNRYICRTVLGYSNRYENIINRYWLNRLQIGVYSSVIFYDYKSHDIYVYGYISYTYYKTLFRDMDYSIHVNCIIGSIELNIEDLYNVDEILQKRTVKMQIHRPNSNIKMPHNKRIQLVYPKNRVFN